MKISDDDIAETALNYQPPTVINGKEKRTGALVMAWESYERNGDKCIALKNENQARNHSLFEVESVTKARIWLTNDEIADFEAGKPIW